MRTFFARTIAFLGSYGLAAILMVLLMLLTLAGTLEQGRSTLYDVQTRYFESVFVIHYIAGKYPVPLPGAMLLLPLLFVNLLVGGLWRMRKGTSTLGIFVVHLGIVLLLAGSWVEHQWSTKGQMKLEEGQSSDEYVAYRKWEVAIREIHPDGSTREYVIPEEEFDSLDGDARYRFQHPDLPFDLVLSGYLPDARPKPAEPGQGVRGYVLAPPPPTKANRNRLDLPGLEALTVAKGGEGGASARGLLFGGQRSPWTLPGAVTGGTRWQVMLRQRRWQLPFTIRLDRFVREVYPGTGVPKRFSSFVTQTESGVSREAHITMNEPLRSQGYTLYQSSWGPQGAPPGTRLFSTFSVVANPSDRVPLIACIVIGVGLLLHFGRKLHLYLKAQQRRLAAERIVS
ncbi:MAG: cytochrome c biogenesis protein ResB [Planctomycetota bacterium]